MCALSKTMRNQNSENVLSIERNGKIFEEKQVIHFFYQHFFSFAVHYFPFSNSLSDLADAVYR